MAPWVLGLQLGQLGLTTLDIARLQVTHQAIPHGTKGGRHFAQSLYKSDFESRAGALDLEKKRRHGNAMQQMNATQCAGRWLHVLYSATLLLAATLGIA